MTVKADGGATNIPVEWDFVKDERGTNGDEFTVRRTGTDNVLWLIPPTNPSVTKTKECTLTFTYGYAGGDMEQTYVCSYEVRPADPVTLSVNPDGAETKADGKYVKDGVSYNPIQIEAKAAGNVRSCISNSSSIGQHLAIAAFADKGYAKQKKEKYAVLKARYLEIRKILKAHPEYAKNFEAMPFNSGYFMCVKPISVDAEKVRKQLIAKYSTGTIILSGLIRLAFSTIPRAKLAKLFANVDAAIRDLRV